MSLLISVSFLLLLLLSSAASSYSNPPSLSAYQVLQSYGFPIGLLPKGVTSYQIDPNTGKFSVQLNNTCTFTIDGYDLKYDTTVTGTISKGKITDLKGIQVKILLFWLNIVEVTKDGDKINFSIGIASAGFPLDNFNQSPQCGCGFDCVNNSAADNRVKNSLRRLIPLLQI